MHKRFKTGKQLSTAQRGNIKGFSQLKPFSFVHAADLHLGYSQYGLEARRQDFDNAFKEVVDRTIELKPDFMIIAGDLFATAVAQVAIAAGRDDSLPTLTGIHVEINQDTITLAATDRYRLAVREVQWQATQPNLEIAALLRARTLADATKSLTGTKNVSVSLTALTSHDRLAGFVSDGKSMTSRMLDGTFPPYRHLLPQNITTTAVIEVAQFLDSVRRVALVTDKTVPLRLSFVDSTLELEAGAGEEAQATEALEILLTGEPINIAFNPVFLADGLQAVGTPYVQISFTGSNKPAILTGKTERDSEPIENYRYLLMPMRYAS